MSDEKIARPYERLGGPGPWRDAIVLTQEEWDAVEPGWEEAEQDRRFAAWLAVLAAPPSDEPNPRPDYPEAP